MELLVKFLSIAIICVMLAHKIHLCPAVCQCLPNKQVRCLKQQLSNVPSGIPTDTTVLELSHNKLQLINKTDFSDFRNLRTLNLDDNEIVFITPGSFWQNQVMQNLNLNENKLTVINRTMLSGLRDINTLFINDNPLEYVEQSAFNDLRKLQRLYVFNSQDNHLNCTCNFFQQMRDLKRRVRIITANCMDVKGNSYRPKNWNDGGAKDRYCGPVKESKTGSIIGGVVGGLFFFICCCCRDRANNPPQPQPPPPPQPQPTPQPQSQPQEDPQPQPQQPPPPPEPVHVPEDRWVTGLSDSPPSYLSIVPFEGDTNAYSNPVFLDDLPPPPSYEEVAGEGAAQNSHWIGQTIILQSVAHPTRLIRKRVGSRGLCVEENDYSKQMNADSSFTVVLGLAGRETSLQAHDDPSKYFRHHDGLCYVEPDDGSQMFKDDSTFIIHPTEFTTEFSPSISLESINCPGFFVSHLENRVQVLPYSGTDEYRRNSSWFPKPSEAMEQ